MNQDRRDLFAAAALSGLVARGDERDDALLLARQAFEIADAVIAWSDSQKPERKVVNVPSRTDNDGFSARP